MLITDILKRPSVYVHYIRCAVQRFNEKLEIETYIKDCELEPSGVIKSPHDLEMAARALIAQCLAQGLTVEITKTLNPKEGMGNGNYLVTFRPNYTEVRKAMNEIDRRKEAMLLAEERGSE